MPSDFLTPFLELDEEFCKNFRGLDVADGGPHAAQKHRAVGFQRRHSFCPVTLPNSKFNSGSLDAPGDSAFWPLAQQLPRSTLSSIPFRVDRSVSMIDPPLPPPPGLSASASSLSSPKSLAATPPISTRYKTELCRTFEESGTCKYGAKCQFAHGMEELRGLNRHPKYKTEPCRTFHTIGFCPYGARCHFIHNADEQHTPPGRQKVRERPQLMRQSVSFSGFSSRPLVPAAPEPLTFARASSVSPPPSTPSPDLLSPFFSDCRGPRPAYPFPAEAEPELRRVYRITDSQSAFTLAGLQRSASADSLSDQDGYTSSSSLSGCESPSFEGRRLPIFSRLSVSDD
ncbi:mRNA decay activator protein ZFP36L1 [Denticeps clupeoides]|uniref:mRNA decay activator protein ZFP36L1 n=1 Tax=Denticeps clupeoides TaxID=299321 RepID=UPI0010A355A0|nr:mRNA decay activator protein ZFP36L1-like [Denticeps clupeoides]